MSRRLDLAALAVKVAHELNSSGVSVLKTARIVDNRYVRLETAPVGGRIAFYFAAPVELGVPIPVYEQMSFFSEDFSQEETRRPAEQSVVPPPWARYAVCLNVMQLSEETQT